MKGSYKIYLRGLGLTSIWKIPILFLISRLFLIVTFTPEGLRGYGDFINFYRLAGMGWPYLDYWSEFPPIFPFMSPFLSGVSGGQEHIFDYLLVFIFTLFQAGNLALFIRIINPIYPPANAQTRIWVYFAILLVLPYGWWYFDPLAVFFALLGLSFLLERKDVSAGISLGIGALVKYFPIFVLSAAWRYRPKKRSLLITLVSLGIIVIVYIGLYLASPDMTTASMQSQFSKGSWETVWALVDGNFNTGNFGPLLERYDASSALILRNNPPRLPSWLTLIPFVCLGLYLLWRARLNDPRSVIAFVGVTWCVFLLWSPGWSPQWVLYLLPLILLTLPLRIGSMFAITLVLINLLEWPVLLSRGYDWGLWLTVPVRTILLILLGIEFWRVIHGIEEKQDVEEVSLDNGGDILSF